MKAFINKEQTLIELRKQKEKDMYNSYKYQALTKAIEIVEGMPEAFVLRQGEKDGSIDL